MAEWHVTPDYIVRNWTDELFDLMVQKFVERNDREKNYAKGVTTPQDNTVSPETLSAMSHGFIKVKRERDGD